ncbi:hypothetical protein [Kineosporia succinea]|uniref:Uncharacterized protein n=1 Tax=Kineosporia succinea TaxID=84632 RepID=A0ABT9PDT2_9ACTN|nr:hypothetical protein [Kineosporia succinea]MDP9830868.1 hypothetical protein [Kineosporia succinea]
MNASHGDAVVIQRVGPCFVLRGAPELAPDQVAWIAKLRTDASVTVALVMVPSHLAAAVGPALSEVLEQMPGNRLVLALSGAGLGRRGRPALARQIADDWDVTVVAPAGDVFLAPGGTLFAWGEGPWEGGSEWWSFPPGDDATPLGPRWPVPDWGPAADVISLGALELRPVPAGMVLCAAGSAPTGPDDVACAVPAQRERPAVLCAVAGEGHGSIPGAVALLTLLLERHSWTRHPLRLVPVGGADLLPLGRAVAREMRLDVEVLSGFPVGGDGRVLAVGDGGRGTWSPFVASVLCRSGAGDVSPLIWRPPAEGLRAVDPVRPVYAFGPDWQLTLTRAGLWLHRPGPGAAPEESAAVDVATVRLDLGAPGAALPSGASEVLAGLVAALSDPVRARLRVVVHGQVDADLRAELGDVAHRHQVRLDVRDIVSTPEHSRTDDAARPAVVTSTPVVTGPPPGEARPRIAPGARDQARAVIGNRWDAHAPAARRAVSRIPALGANDLAAAAAVDLVSLSLFMAARPDDPFGPVALRSPLRSAEQDAYLACLDSGLGLLPTHRGPVVRGADASRRWREGPPAPGSVLTEAGPAGATALVAGAVVPRPATTGMYVIWAQTARVVTPLLDDRPQAGDVMFAPGTRLRVLDTWLDGPGGLDLVFLQEVPANGTPPVPAGDRALGHLRQAVGPASLRETGGTVPWPAYALGVLGPGTPARQTSPGL